VFQPAHVLKLLQVIEAFLEQDAHVEIRHLQLTATDWTVLQDIRGLFSIPHAFQEILAFEKTPTLAVALPMYEKAISMLDDYMEICPKLAHVARAMRDALLEYMHKSRKSRLYALAIGAPILAA
jgi:hypothetical protein